ncbi:MAG: hypothetical protein IPG45_05920 [Deltaproteobacteria bacterium]|nr:hypothetical protein [Deltaproteobacteria bacterium]
MATRGSGSNKGGALIKLGLDLDEMKAQLSELNESFANSFTELNNTLEVFGKIGAAIGSAVDALSEYAAAAGEVEVIERRAQAAIGGRMTALQTLNTARQVSLGIDADEQLKLQTKLAQLGVQKDQLDAATEATIGLASVTGGDLASAGTTVAKVFDGNIAALGRMGIHVTSVTEAKQRMAEMFRVTETEVGTYDRSLKALEATMGDTGEAIGKLIIEDEDFRRGMSNTTLQVGLLNRAISALGEPSKDFLKEAAWQAVDTFTFGIAGNLNRAGDSLADAERKLQEMDKRAAEARAKYKDPITEYYLSIARAYSPDPNYRGVFGEGGVPTAGYGADQGTFNMIDDARRGGRPRGGRSGRGISLSSSDIGNMFDQQGFGAEATSNADFLSNPFFDASAAPGRVTTDDGGEMKDRLKRDYDEAQNILGLTKEMQAETQALADTAASGLGNVIGGMIQAMVEGSANLAEVLGQLVGQMIMNLGMLLIQTGAAAVALGALSLIPGLGFITGPPGVGIAAGAVALGVGAGLVAVGAAMGGGGGGAGASAPAARGGGGASRAAAPTWRGNAGDALPLGGQGMAQPMVMEVHFNGVVGDPKAVRRQIADLMAGGNRLTAGAT